MFKGDIDKRRASTASTFASMAERAIKRMRKAVTRGNKQKAKWERDNALYYKQRAIKAVENIGNK